MGSEPPRRGRLPGDVLIEHGGVRVLIPTATPIAVSVVLTVLRNLAVRLRR